MTIDSCKLDYCIKRGMELIGWPEKFPRRTVGAHKVRGVGMAIAMQGSGIANIDMASAIIKLNDDGFFNLLVGATDIGTGSDTILAQIAAETLRVDTRSIVVYSSDTDLTPFDKGAYASSTTYVSGNAVKKAAENMRRMILSEGARKLRVAEDGVTFDGETLSRTDGKGSISLKDLATGLFYHANQKQLITSDS
jgi:CO/xanthine dehydrogenase Mo-binding subunit